MDFDMTEICREVNSRASEYVFRDLQKIRHILNGKKITNYSIFSESKTVFEDYAFNYGGRSEVQFNLGKTSVIDPPHKEGLRFGLAFSLQPSQDFPNPIQKLKPYIDRFNALLDSKPNLFSDYKFYSDDGEWECVRKIEAEEIVSGNFIFFGKTQEKYDIDEILETFDQMFPIYTAVLGLPPESFESYEKESLFYKTDNQPATYRILSAREATKSNIITVWHTLIQNRLAEELEAEYGKDNVSKEMSVKSGKVDVALHTEEGDIYFEIKTASTSLGCINEAMGQLLYYAYFPNKKSAIEIVVVGKEKLDNNSSIYLEHLKKSLGLPISYRQVKI